MPDNFYSIMYPTPSVCMRKVGGRGGGRGILILIENRVSVVSESNNMTLSLNKFRFLSNFHGYIIGTSFRAD